MKKQKLIDEIFEICWAYLMSHKDTEDNQIFSETNKSLTWQHSLDEEDLITEEGARILLKSWIRESYHEHEFVFLYTCPDNALIAIEDDIDITDPAFLEFKDMCDKHPELPLYIAHD